MTIINRRLAAAATRYYKKDSLEAYSGSGSPRLRSGVGKGAPGSVWAKELGDLYLERGAQGRRREGGAPGL
jgi:hypothetical protein